MGTPGYENGFRLTILPDRLAEPLAVVEGLPGGGAELTPVQPRALADGLLRIVAEAEAQPMGARIFMRKSREYCLGKGA